MADKVLSFSEFVEGDGVDYVEVAVRGGRMRLGSITAEDYIGWLEYRNAPVGSVERKGATAWIIIKSLVDAEGKRIGDLSEIPRIQKMNIKYTEALLKAIFKLNGINQKDDTDAKKD